MMALVGSKSRARLTSQLRDDKNVQAQGTTAIWRVLSFLALFST